MASPKSGRDYLGEFLPGLRNIANIPAESEALSQQMTHTPSQSPYQQFQQEYPEIDQYLRDVASGQMAYTGLQDLASNLNRSYDDPSALEEYLGFGGMTAFHGSPHKFGKFLMDKIGTGEGAQAYGHGLYFAESPGVAKSYQYDLSRNINALKKADRAHVAAADDFKAHNYSLNDARDGMKKAYPNATDIEIDTALNEAYKYQGHLYEVDIPDEQINKMLDWDAPLSEQPENVRQALADDIRQLHLDSRSGENLYNELSRVYGSPEEASKAMAEMGIPGIKYFDQVSRGTGEGTRNFVVFDEDIVKILDRK